MSIIARTARWACAACVGLAMASGAWAQAGQPPIRIGSTLALTGPLAATSLIDKVVGDIYVQQLNKRGGRSVHRSSGSSRTTSPSPTSRAPSTSN